MVNISADRIIIVISVVVAAKFGINIQGHTIKWLHSLTDLDQCSGHMKLARLKLK